MLGASIVMQDYTRAGNPNTAKRIPCVSPNAKFDRCTPGLDHGPSADVLAPMADGENQDSLLIALACESSLNSVYMTSNRSISSI